MEKKKILVFNGYYYPAKNYGGPATSMYNLVNACGDEFDFYIIVHDHDLDETSKFAGIHDGWNQVGNAMVNYQPDEAFNFSNYSKWFRTLKPDLIWLVAIYSLQTIWRIRLAETLNIPVLMSPRGALNEEAVKIKAYKKRPFLALEKIARIYKNTYFHVTSEQEKLGSVKYLNVSDDRIYKIPNISNRPDKEQTMIEKQEGAIRIAYIARISNTKGLLTALQAINMVSGKVVFHIYGPKEDSGYWEECLKEINRKNDECDIEYLGVLDQCKVKETFKQYHCFVFPTKTENYGHSIAESLLAGCPVILPKGTTPWDDLDGVAGFTVPNAEVEMFAEKISKIVDMNQDEYNQMRNKTMKYVEEKTNYSGIKEQYIDMLNSITRSE